MSPAQVEIQLRRWMNFWPQLFSANRSLFFKIIFVLLSAVIFHFEMAALTQQLGAFRGHFLLQAIHIEVLILLGFSAFSSLFDRFASEFNFCVLIVAWLVNTYLHIPTLGVTLASQFGIGFLVDSLLGYWVIRAQPPARKQLFLIFSFVFWTFFALACQTAISKGLSSLIYVFSYKHFLFYIVIFYFYRSQSNSPDRARISFCPTNALTGVLWPLDSRWVSPHDPDFHRLWWKGALDILIALFSLCALVVFNGRTKNYQALLFVSAQEYFLGLFALITVSNIVSGTARLFGFRVKDATHFVLLSASPAEFWKRGLSYQYEFLFNYVFFPIKRRVRNVFVAIALSFSGFFINKGEIFAILILWAAGSGHVSSAHSKHYLGLIGVHWLFYQLILIGWRLFAPEARFRGAISRWLFIVATHTLFIAVFLLAKLLSH